MPPVVEKLRKETRKTMSDNVEKKKGSSRFLNIYKNNTELSTLTALLCMLVIQIIVTVINGGSLGLTWLNILRNNVYQGVIALGLCFAILSGGIDISVGSMLCALGAVLMYLIDPNSGLLVSLGLSGPGAYIIAILLTLLCGAALGCINGLLISFGRIPPFIATLGTMKIFRSVTQQLTQTFNPTVPDGFKAISSTRIGGEVILPILYWIVLVAICFVISRYTAFGIHVVAIGSNEKGSELCGLNVRKNKTIIYGLVGISCAIAAIIYVSRIGSMDFANAGSGYEMDAIAAVIVGGTSMRGGKGSLIGAFMGMLIIGLMNNILNSIDIPTFLCEAVKGLIILFAVLLQKKE